MQENIAPSVFDELSSDAYHFEYATVGQRFANYLIDSVVYYIFNIGIFFLMGIVLALSGKDEKAIQDIFESSIVAYGFSYINYMLIYTLVEGFTKGRTIGKLITRTVAVKIDDMSKITWNEAVIRSAIRLVPFEPLSALGNNPWHDKWSNTTVIKKRQKI